MARRDMERGSPSRRKAVGVLSGALVSIAWGTQFPIAKEIYARVDPYSLTVVRYGAVAVVLLGALVLREGRAALRFDGLFGRVAVVGVIGIALSVILAYVGIQHSRPQDASLVAAAGPLLTAVLLRARREARLLPVTLASMVAAAVGVLLVITRGHPTAIAGSSVGWGLALVLAAQLAWAYYTVEGASFPGWSTLRFSALTALVGTVAAIAITAAVTPLGWAKPSGGAMWAEHWRLLYMLAGPTLVALIGWNAARAALGAQNTALFLNLIPVTAFVYVSVQGYRPGWAEILGALIVIAALVANNLFSRPEPLRGAAARAPSPDTVEGEALVAEIP